MNIVEKLKNRAHPTFSYVFASQLAWGCGAKEGGSGWENQLTAVAKADMIGAELNSAMNGKSTAPQASQRGRAHRLQGPPPPGEGSASASAGDAEALRRAGETAF